MKITKSKNKHTIKAWGIFGIEENSLLPESDPDIFNSRRLARLLANTVWKTGQPVKCKVVPIEVTIRTPMVASGAAKVVVKASKS